VGSVVLAVVDPGVGSSRRAVVIEGERHVWVAPDNGLLEAALTVDPAKRAFEIDSRRFRVTSATFHGRDVFGPAAAHLASGASIETLGSETPVSTLVRLGVLPSRGPNGELWTFDHYGNAITTIRAPGERPAAVRVRGREIRFATHYAEVERGEALALVGSSGLVEISVRDGSARAALGLQEGDAITLV
jgi:S-adenosylmethionine hydrolase